MRILIDLDRLSSDGGVEMSVLQVGQELVCRGHELDLLYLKDGDLTAEFRSLCRSVKNVPTFSFARGNGLRDLRGLAPAVWKGSRCRPDVVYVNRFSEVVFGVLTGWASRAPVVCHLRYVSYHRPTHLMGRRVQRFIAVSHAQKADWVRAGLEDEWIDVVHNGIDPAAYPLGAEEERRRAREVLGLPLDSFVVLYLGRLSPEKGVDVLLDAWKELGIDPDQGRLLMVGRPVVPSAIPNVAQYQQKLYDMAPPGCEWLPVRRDVVTPMHAADVVVLPSRSESFGRTVLEAMATGRPVLGSRVGGIPEILTGELERFLFPEADVKVLGEKLASLVGWQQREPELAGSCVEHVQANFSLNKTVDGIERVLLEAADAG